MKYILLSIHSGWCCEILNGKKKIEVRKGTTLYNAINRLIKEQGKAPCLMYCTKGEPFLREYPFCLTERLYQLTDDSFNALNGKVVAEFEASAEVIESNQFSIRFTKTLNAFELEERSCLTQTKIANYLVDNDGSPILGTAIHIKEKTLKIFDKPKKLWEFDSPNGFIPCEKCLLYKSFLKGKCKGEHCNSLYKAPQSWCYCEVNE